MLFLAVFCGFLAENFREHLTDKKKEHEYIQSMTEDLKTEINKLSIIDRDYGKLVTDLTFLLNHYDEFTDGDYILTHTNALSALDGFTDYIYTDRTIDQLNNSGGMRLITNKAAADSIISYDAEARDLLIEESGLGLVFTRVTEVLEKFINRRAIRAYAVKYANHQPDLKKPDFLLTHDKQSVEGFYNLLADYRNTVMSKREQAIRLEEKAKRVKNYLQKEYGLE